MKASLQLILINKNCPRQDKALLYIEFVVVETKFFRERGYKGWTSPPPLVPYPFRLKNFYRPCPSKFKKVLTKDKSALKGENKHDVEDAANETAGNRPDFTPINFLWHSAIDLSSGLFLNRQKRFYEVGRRAKMQETKYANARAVMKMIYVSHPYTGNEEANVEDAMKVTNRLAQATKGSFLFVNPLAVFGDMGETLTYDQILDQCLELLDRCDGVIFCDGWTRSRGCQAEMDKALQANKAIWFGPEHFIAKNWKQKIVNVKELKGNG